MIRNTACAFCFCVHSFTHIHSERKTFRQNIKQSPVTSQCDLKIEIRQRIRVNKFQPFISLSSSSSSSTVISTTIFFSILLFGIFK